eukprot:gnl/TRDRNA2_/TRDRNA2_36459_c0_seq1.p1 gnl/TRDRNA2_/TRDRNA2_36459_c0~~gnl/TRDRNA2_/TRDRNA2_36459_c0_seq1.p1  ORF type:complete len:593 (+),score=127.09 gnl/TRDRNA2_/TRDRNA2_36459_c0_seq1:75-1853(+)
MAQLWEIVGGADKGGIMVREGPTPADKKLDDKLATKSLVEEIEVKDGKLYYKLASGSGPKQGWITIKLPDKELAVKTDKKPPGGGSAAAEVQEEFDMAAFTKSRCDKELKKPPVKWTPVDMGVLEKVGQKSKGMIYNIEFPWDAATLEQMGAAWCDKAFHLAETIPKDVKVTKLKNVKAYIGGGNCSKLTFEVEYSKNVKGLHTKLFAKIPFPLDGKTRSDRMASSIMQQGQDIGEINAHRLFESRLPFEIPRYYFGDVSNETTNWILITQQIPFGQRVDDRVYDPPYEKGRDWELKGTSDEYYFLLLKRGAKMCGAYKAGELSPQEVMDKLYQNPAYTPPEAWGMGPHCTGLQEPEYKAKIKMGAEFISEIGKALFPPKVADPKFVNETWKKAIGITNAYKAEIQFWVHRKPEYIVWSHGNLNVDNVFFWRNEDGTLDVGLLDWGGAGISSIGWKLWWWLYSAEFDFLNEKIDQLMEFFIDEYKSSGGPQLEADELKWQFTLAALDQGVGLLGAVPQMYRMCKKAEWATITDRKDPRIANNVDGKNTLRIYTLTFISVARIVAEWGTPAKLDDWVGEVQKLTTIPPKQPFM